MEEIKCSKHGTTLICVRCEFEKMGIGIDSKPGEKGEPRTEGAEGAGRK
ncbi:MAG: hypothetical protein ACYTEQ_24825 [Planctomycetota bacterium]|jgi:hypothetical protein